MHDVLILQYYLREDISLMSWLRKEADFNHAFHHLIYLKLNKHKRFEYDEEFLTEIKDLNKVMKSGTTLMVEKNDKYYTQPGRWGRK